MSRKKSSTEDHKPQEGVAFQSSEHALARPNEGAAVAIIVCPELIVPSGSDRTTLIKRAAEGRLVEVEGLARSISLDIAHSFSVKLKKQHPGTYIGGGIVEKLAELKELHDARLIIVDAKLSPIQQRNLETKTGAKILDRTGLILEIFGQRAQTREGVLQVELAHLSYQKGRLVRSWTHLERQRGGAGFMGGPGETQIESDRRQLSIKIENLKKSIKTVRSNRAVQRSARISGHVPTIALVGYTNAGKSTFFNHLTKARVYQKDQLFATLDTTHRKVTPVSGPEFVLSDTVGFISDLPTELVAAFHATLEEVLMSDILVHVIDVSHDEWLEQHDDVIDVLQKIGVDVPKTDILNVWNKVDLLDEETKTERLSHIRRLYPDEPNPLLLSAQSGQGVDEFLASIFALFSKEDFSGHLKLPASKTHLMHWLYQYGQISEREEFDNGDVALKFSLPKRLHQEFVERFGPIEAM